MKEIDLLPEWYKSGRRRQFTYRAQYTILGGIFAVIMVWNFVSGYSVSKASAELGQMESQAESTKCISQEYNEIKTEIAELQEKAKFIDQIDSKIDIANILAEMSFLIDERIVLNKVEFNAEEITAGQQAGSTIPQTGLRQARGRRYGSQNAKLLGKVKFKVMISGVAANVSDVAELICKLEDSPYFCKVVPSFSRNTEVKMPNNPLLQPTAAGDGKLRASEFEITCQVANYQEK